MAADIGAYDPPTAKMILEVVNYLKASGLVLTSTLPGESVMSASRLHIATVTTEITARSSTTAGKGRAELQHIPGVAGTATTLTDYPASGVAEIDVYNIVQTSIAVGKMIFVAREFGSGKWVVVVEDCSP